MTPADFTLVPSDPQGGPVVTPIFGYEMQYHNAPYIPFAAQNTEVPMFIPYDRDNPVWWDENVDELLFSRTTFTLLHGRGCFNPLNPSDNSGDGNMCPHLLTKMVDAVNRAGAQNVMKFGMFIDTGAIPGGRAHWVGSNVGFDLTPVADSSGRPPLWYFWDADIKVFFDTIPKSMWYLYNDNGTLKPVISMWNLRGLGFTNTNNNLRILLENIRDAFKARYGMTPFFNLDVSWTQLDPTIVNDPGLVGATNNWFAADLLSTYTQVSFGGKTWGVLVPAFRNPGTPTGCGSSCREIPRNHGATFAQGFTANSTSSMTIIEGFTDTLENCGSYRSDDPQWDYPNQDLDIIRQYSDPTVPSLRFQAETADVYLNATNKPATVFRYHKALGVIPLGTADQGTGWALGSTTAGEALIYKHILFPAATYKFTARVSSPINGNRLHFSIDSTDLPVVTIPNTGDAQTYVVVNLGSVPMTSGFHDLKLTLDTGGVNVDWFFAKHQ